MSQKPKKQSNSNRLLFAIKTGLYLGFFMPLIVSGHFVFPYIFPKQAFFQIIVELIFGAYLFLALKDPRYRPRSSKFLWALLIYFFILILSAIFGQNPYHSFWSNYERMAGVISLWHYLGFLLVAINIFKTKEDWYRFFDFSIMVSLLEAFYGFYQLFGAAGNFSSGARIDGTIGNTSFLAGYMLFNSLFALWLFLEKKDWRWRLFYAGAMAINLFILYETQTRGAMLGLAGGLLMMVFFLIFASRSALSQLTIIKEPARLKKYAAGLLCLMLLSGSLIFYFRNSAFVKSHPTISRLANISFQETTSKTRLLAWQMTLTGFKDHPLFGWGPENYNLLFNQYYNPDLYPIESWFDRAHNAFLDVLANTGLIGFAAYLSIFVLAFRSIWRAWRRNKIAYPAAVIFTTILFTYAIQNFFVFDTQVTLLMIFAVFSFIGWLSLNSADGAPVPGGQPFKPNYLFSSLVLLAVIGMIYFFNVKPGKTSIDGIEALRFLQTNQINSATGQFRLAYENGTFGQAEVAARAFDSTLPYLNSPQVAMEDKKTMVSVAMDGLKAALKLEPKNARYMMMLANLYLAANSLDESYLTEANLLMQRALELSPTRQELYFALGQVRVFQGRGEEALILFKKAIDLNEKIPVSHWNYGLVAISIGHKDLGEAEIKKAVELGHSYDGAEIGKLINAYGLTKDWPPMIALYQEWLKIEPNSAVAYAGLAATYAQAGDKPKAKSAALQAAQIDPTYKDQADQFIQSLGL